MNGATIKGIHCMAESFLAVTEKDQKKELYTWGWNEHGNLGLGDKLDRHRPTLVPFSIDEGR